MSPIWVGANKILLILYSKKNKTFPQYEIRSTKFASNRRKEVSHAQIPTYSHNCFVNGGGLLR